MTSTDRFLEEAIQEARQGLREGGIPIGSVIVHGDTILGRGHNRRVQKLSAILHGEMDASRAPAVSPPRSTESAFSIQRSHPALCAPVPFCCTEFAASSSARTAPSWEKKNSFAPAACRLRSFKTRNVSGLWRSSYEVIPRYGMKTSACDTCS